MISYPGSFRRKHPLKVELLNVNMHLIFVLVPLNVENRIIKRFHKVRTVGISFKDTIQWFFSP